MTTISTFAVTSDGAIQLKDALVSVELRQGLGVHVTGIGDFPAREMLLRVLNALSASGCIVGKKQINVDIFIGGASAAERHRFTAELFDLPVAVAIMNELGFAKFDTSMRLRYIGQLCADGRIELLGDAVYIACHDRVFMGHELVCANTVWDELKVGPGHVYLAAFRRAFNLTEELTKVQTRGTVVSVTLDEVHGVRRCTFDLRTAKTGTAKTGTAKTGGQTTRAEGMNEADGILHCTMMNKADGGASFERMAPGVSVVIEGRARQTDILVNKLQYL